MQTVLLEKVARLQDEIELERSKRVLAEEKAQDACSDEVRRQLKTDLELQKKESLNLREEVETLKSTLEAARTENSSLVTRYSGLLAATGDDGATSGIVAPGSTSEARPQDSVSGSTAAEKSLRRELDEEKRKWDKERTDMQEQIQKLLQACMEEENESEMARKREAAAREQLNRLNALLAQEGGASGVGANLARVQQASETSAEEQSAASSRAPKTPGTPSLARNDPMYLGFGEGVEGADWQARTHATPSHSSALSTHWLRRCCV
jgi:DNA repair exonuclease SbcCD ATPase subunit